MSMVEFNANSPRPPWPAGGGSRRRHARAARLTADGVADGPPRRGRRRTAMGSSAGGTMVTARRLHARRCPQRPAPPTTATAMAADLRCHCADCGAARRTTSPADGAARDGVAGDRRCRCPPLPADGAAVAAMRTAASYCDCDDDDDGSPPMTADYGDAVATAACDCSCRSSAHYCITATALPMTRGLHRCHAPPCALPLPAVTGHAPPTPPWRCHAAVADGVADADLRRRSPICLADVTTPLPVHGRWRRCHGCHLHGDAVAHALAMMAAGTTAMPMTATATARRRRRRCPHGDDGDWPTAVTAMTAGEAGPVADDCAASPMRGYALPTVIVITATAGAHADADAITAHADDRHAADDGHAVTALLL